MTYVMTQPAVLDLARLVERHGARRVLVALMKALIARRRTRRATAQLSDHLRRDIGLPPQAPAPRHWEIR
jgi:uncharacterized protein YjiS (DUF1127 family)